MKKEKTFEDEISPERDELISTEDGHRAEIIDAELDVLKCSFHGDLTVVIDTKGYSYVNLTVENLETLIRLINEEKVCNEQIFASKTINGKLKY
jgi:hypothetical protein